MRIRSRAVAVAAALTIAATAASGVTSASGAPAAPVATYQITFTNVTDGQWFTPPNVAAHVASADVFQIGQPASAGVQAVAENGDVPALAAELAGAIDANGLGSSTVGGGAPVAPGASVTFALTADSSARQLSIVSMLICTNDGFAGLDGRRLPQRVGDVRDYSLKAFDAGTEINTEADADIVPAPFCLGSEIGSGMSNAALAENGVVHRHSGIEGVGDFGESFDWDGAVAEVTIERIS